MIYAIVGLNNNLVTFSDKESDTLFLFDSIEDCSIMIEQYNILSLEVIAISNIISFFDRYLIEDKNIRVAMFNSIVDGNISYCELGSIKEYIS